MKRRYQQRIPRRIVVMAVMMGALVMGLCGCYYDGPPSVVEGMQNVVDGQSDMLDGPPQLPDRPFPGNHDGLFVSEHGTMRFNGDGKSITIDFDEKLAKMTGLPQGEYSGTYQFLSGEMPPAGRMELRYDYAHAIGIQVDADGDGKDDTRAVIDVGEVTEDGSYHTGTGCTTADRITFQFYDNEWEYLDFLKAEEGN